ncbi:hypothetical protein TNCV_2975261 [Trichonephila clavipes]|nr:hypothetical protein TNCV_2975261 [Trichonephila clavipes]
MDHSISDVYSNHQIHFRTGGHAVNHGSDRSLFLQVLMHPSKRLRISLTPRWISFSIQSKSSMLVYVGQAVDEVDIRQLGVRITINVHRMLSMSEMRKPHVPILRAHMQRHLSLFTHNFLCNYDSSHRYVLYLSSKFVHRIRGYLV